MQQSQGSRLQRLRAKFKAKPQYLRLYLIGFGIVIFAFAWLMYVKRPDALFYLLAWIGFGMFATGFVQWVLPTLKRIWAQPLGKTVFAFFHAFLLVFALVPARDLVANSIGLPPQDYVISVAFWGLFLYPFVWIGVLAIALSVLYFCLFLTAIAVSVTTLPGANDVLLYIARLLPESSPSRRFIQTDRYSFVNTFIGHAGGAMVVALIMAALNDLMWDQTWRLKPAARLVAAVSDYQVISRYPGVDEERPALIHENGLVSYAEKTGPWTVNFTIERVGEGADSQENFPQP